MTRSRITAMAAILGICLASGPVWAFDHRHAVFDALLAEHVAWINDGVASGVDYAALKKDRPRLQRYLEQLSAVSRQQFDAWAPPQQLAFLINAYNAFTLELILMHYPDLDSIKDLGSFLKSPWKKKFFHLLGQERHLDNIEHDIIRAPGRYDDPRIHFAVNCASVGCPALRTEAYVGDRLGEQMEDNLIRFLSDRSRNRYNPQTGALEVSRIFDWYGDDFRKGYRGDTSLADFFARYARYLTDDPQHRQAILAKEGQITYLGYDWALNDLARSSR